MQTDLQKARTKILEMLDPVDYDRSTIDSVEAALDLIEKGKVQKNTFTEYIMNYLIDRTSDHFHVDCIDDGDLTPEDCLFFFKEHGFKIIE